MKRRHYSGNYLKSWVYGGLDGIITTFAIVSGVIGAGLEYTVILILGFANLLADGISMGVGDYLSTKSEKEYYRTEIRKERKAFDQHPKREKASMISLYKKQGFSVSDAKKLVSILSKNKTFWTKEVMHEELGIVEEQTSATKHGMITFFSFLLFGLLPLLLYLISAIFRITIRHEFVWAAALTGIAMFILGTTKAKITQKHFMRSGFETLFIGGVAAVAAYGVGALLSGLLG